MSDNSTRFSTKMLTTEGSTFSCTSPIAFSKAATTASAFMSDVSDSPGRSSGDVPDERGEVLSAPAGDCHEACELSTFVASTVAVFPPEGTRLSTEAAGALAQARSIVVDATNAAKTRCFRNLNLTVISVL